MAVHVPAWRRLGLTLKNDTPSHALPEVHSTSQVLESTHETETPASSNKKRKLQDATQYKGEKQHGAETLDIKTPRPLPRGQTRENFLHALTKNSNGFDDSPAATPSVTLIDKASTKQSHSKYGAAESGRHEARANGHAARQRAGESADSSLNKSVNVKKRSNSEANDGSEPVLDLAERKRIKRLKRAARRQPWLLDQDEGTSTKDVKEPSPHNGASPQNQAASSSSKSPPTASSSPTITQAPHLLYLTTFHTSPTTWKFNKNHQTSLLKHALDPVALPNTHLPALLAYLSGLRGTAARRRILDTARATLAELGEGTMDASPAAAKHAAHRDAKILKSALKKTHAEYEARKPDALEAKARRERAEAVLAQVTGVWPEAASQQTAAQQAASQEPSSKDQFLAADYLPAPEKGFPSTPAKGKRVRARKRRTAASESSSSSESESESSAVSSSSSESGSESLEDDDGTESDGTESDGSGESSESSSSEDGE